MTDQIRLRKEEWFVDDASLTAGQQMVQQYHYARGGSNTAVYMHGLYDWKNGDLHGIAWWLPPTRVACESVNKEHWKKVLSLTRMVILPNTPKNACSFLLARSVRRIKKDGRFVSLVTYADESQDHTGLVYRASNWAYVGRTGPYPRWMDPKNKKQVASKATVNRDSAKMKELGYVKQGSFYKHKYVLHL